MSGLPGRFRRCKTSAAGRSHLTLGVYRLRFPPLADEANSVSTPIHIWVCDYAAVNVDGTVTIVRGGSEKWEAASLPGNALTWIYVEIEPGALSVGDHTVETSIINTSDVRLAEVKGNLNILEKNQRARFVIPMTVMIQAYGDLRVVVRVGNVVGERKILMERKGVVS